MNEPSNNKGFKEWSVKMIKDEKEGQVTIVDTMEKCHNLESDDKIHKMPT